MQIVEKTTRGWIIDGIVDREVRSRNFGGEEKKDKITGRTVNSPGYRNFLLFVSEEIAEEMAEETVEELDEMSEELEEVENADKTQAEVETASKVSTSDLLEKYKRIDYRI